MSRILLVEDEDHLAQGLAYNLRNSGYDVEIATTGEEALEAVERRAVDLMLLDVMLPGINGIEVATRLRRTGQIMPIVMLSAKDRTADSIAGLEAGADDYITKPFDLDEVLARIRGALRRQVWGRTFPNAQNAETMEFGPWRIDFQRFLATRPEGQEVRFSPKELGILRLFASRPGEVISREAFLEEVWGLPGSLETRTVDNFIRKLRQALEEHPSRPRHITSVRGAGYRFVP
ncbi:MAG: response regulator transcription factor [Acidobacteriota bacterium]